jgi:hypothetical protein
MRRSFAVIERLIGWGAALDLQGYNSSSRVKKSAAFKGHLFLQPLANSAEAKLTLA